MCYFPASPRPEKTGEKSKGKVFHILKAAINSSTDVVFTNETSHISPYLLNSPSLHETPEQPNAASPGSPPNPNVYISLRVITWNLQD